MTGLERNSDIVFAASYAPLLQVSRARPQAPGPSVGAVLTLRPSSTSTPRSGWVHSKHLQCAVRVLIRVRQTPDLISYECVMRRPRESRRSS